MACPFLLLDDGTFIPFCEPIDKKRWAMPFYKSRIAETIVIWRGGVEHAGESPPALFRS